MSVHPEYRRVFEQLGAHGIRFCLLRDEIEEGSLVRDLDMLVDTRRFADALSVLDALGYKVKVSERYIPFKTALVKFVDGEFVAIDLHREVVQRGIAYMNSEQVLARRRRVDGYYLPSEADFLMILLFHNIIGKGAIQDKHYPQIRRLMDAVDRRSLGAALAEYKTNDALFSILNDLEAYRTDRDRVDEMRRRLLRILRRSLPAKRKRLIRRRLMGWWRRRGLRPRAPMYALLGVDGVGKSSLNRALLDLLNHQSPFTATSIYMGPWGHYQLRLMGGEPYVPGWSLTTREWLQRLWRRRDAPERGASLRVTLKVLLGRQLDSQDQKAHQIVRESSRLYLTLRYFRSLLAASRFFLMLTAEMGYRYWRAYRHRRRGTIVITDRYIYDLMTGRMHQVVPHYRRVRELLCRLFFRPTRVFLLKSDRKTILSRSRDLSREALEQFETVYEELAARYGFETVWIDAPPKKLAQRLVERHFEEMLAILRT